MFKSGRNVTCLHTSPVQYNSCLFIVFKSLCLCDNATFKCNAAIANELLKRCHYVARLVVALFMLFMHFLC